MHLGHHEDYTKIGILNNSDLWLVQYLSVGDKILVNTDGVWTPDEIRKDAQGNIYLKNCRLWGNELEGMKIKINDSL